MLQKMRCWVDAKCNSISHTAPSALNQPKPTKINPACAAKEIKQ